MLKSKKIVDWLYNYSLYFIIGALLLVIIAIEPSFVRVSNFTTILTQSATKIIYACGIAGIIVLGGTDLALGREVGLAAVVAASLLQAVDYSQRVFSADQVPALPLIVPLRNKGKRRLAGNANQPIIINIDDVADVIDVRAKDEFARVELLVSLKQELERLSPRELMIIRTYLDYPIEVVARKLKVRPNTISKARRKIARELRKKLV